MDVQSNRYEGCLTVGPWGGDYGAGDWSYKPEGMLRQIIVASGWVIDSIMFKSQNDDGSTSYSDRFGGRGGDKTFEINIDGPAEYLTAIRGTFNKYNDGPVVVTSLAFNTNVKGYGPFGRTNGSHFSCPVKTGTIVGFMGRAGRYLESIGVIVRPSFPSSSAKPIVYSQDPSSPAKPIVDSQEVGNVLKNNVVVRDPGPFGCNFGKKWDDGVNASIKQVIVKWTTITMAGSAVQSVQFFYEKDDGITFWSPVDIGSCYGKSERLELQDGEFLVGISGFYGRFVAEVDAIRSLSFYTNKGMYGPFGSEIGTYFTSFNSPAYSGKILGFFGSSDQYLRSIGVHMKYF